jgi:hypothetical protein
MSRSGPGALLARARTGQPFVMADALTSKRRVVVFRAVQDEVALLRAIS